MFLWICFTELSWLLNLLSLFINLFFLWKCLSRGQQSIVHRQDLAHGMIFIWLSSWRVLLQWSAYAAMTGWLGESQQWLWPGWLWITAADHTGSPKSMQGLPSWTLKENWFLLHSWYKILVVGALPSTAYSVHGGIQAHTPSHGAAL